MRIRLAKKSDKDKILQFCTDTFTWSVIAHCKGDYIDRVFDIWYKEPYGELLIAEEDNIVDRTGGFVHNPNSQPKTNNTSTTITNTTTKAQPIALAHAVICPNKTRLWIEGIRVKQSYRRNKVASALTDKGLNFGRRTGALEASAIISVKNTASRLLLEKKGFYMVSKWSYYNIQVSRSKSSRLDDKNKSKNETKKRMANLEDVENVWNYLQCSETYHLSGKRYFEAWRWYSLDYRKIVEFTKHHKIVISENNNSMIVGLAVINDTGYWNRSEVFQIVYLDSPLSYELQSLISYCTDLQTFSDTANDGRKSNNDNTNCINNKSAGRNDNPKQLEIISYQTNALSEIMDCFEIIESSQFVLYNLTL